MNLCPRRLRIAAILATGSSVLLSAQEFRSGVEVVQLSVTVTSGRRVITDLTRDDFLVTDNGVRQTLIAADGQSLPIDLTLVVDGTATTGGAIVGNSEVAVSLQAAIRQLRGELGSQDRVRVLTYAGTVDEAVARGSPDALSAFAVPYLEGMPRDAPVARLHDALVEALAERAFPGRRQVAILLPAGEDKGSTASAELALDAVRRSGMPVFVVGSMIDPKPRATADTPIDPRRPDFDRDYLAGSRPLPTKFLNQVATLSGARLHILEPGTYFANNPQRVTYRFNATSINDTVLGAIRDFRSSYTLSFSPIGVEASGWHELNVRVTRRGSYEVRTRKGYLR